MGNLVKGFLKIKQYDVNLVTFCESFLDCYNELCLARAFLPEAILIVFEDVVSQNGPSRCNAGFEACR